MKTKRMEGSPAVLVAAGFIIGYAFLHPASLVVVCLFEKDVFDFFAIVIESFSVSHLAMGAYFAVIGALLGGIVAVYLVSLRKTNVKLFDINNGLKRQNEKLRQKVSASKTGNEVLLKKIRPVLNRIENGVDIISNKSAGGLNLRQTALLKITKDNIDRLYEVIESLVLGSPGRCDNAGGA
ncbi:MAG: hypothetical protein JW881_02295 [Spirochaetales bacterium]|nr:hypothetical protein [Spirochaetales bacterium]